MSIPKRVHGPAHLGAVAATLYTVPSERVLLVRNIHVCNETAGDLTFTLSLGADAPATRVFAGEMVNSESSYDSFAPFVLTAGQVIQAFASAAASLTITIDGEEELVS